MAISRDRRDCPQLPRAGLIFNALPLEWTAHTAPRLSPVSTAYEGALTAVEVLKTARYLIWRAGRPLRAITQSVPALSSGRQIVPAALSPVGAV